MIFKNTQRGGEFDTETLLILDKKEKIYCKTCKGKFKHYEITYYCKETGAFYCRSCEIRQSRKSLKHSERYANQRGEHIHHRAVVFYGKA
jgi:late competence protein required for DNA uptake (superfamily II DNA/RNA helicase)